MIGATTSQTLWHAIEHSSYPWVDPVILLVLGVGNVGAWVTLDMAKAEVGDAHEAADRVRTAAGAAVAAVGFLLPLTVLAVQTRGAGSAPVPPQALADFFVAEIWLAASLASGAFVLALIAMRGYVGSILKERTVPIVFGFELVFLLMGIVRFMFGASSLTSALLRS